MKKLGVVMLDTSFTRIIGDIGHPETFNFPVIYDVVKNASIDRVVNQADPNLLKPFIESAQKLEARGATLITTSCGFLSLFQMAISSQIASPFIASSLVQVSLLQKTFKGKIGILTARKKRLTEAHLRAVNIEMEGVVIEGMDEMRHFNDAIIKEISPLDPKIIDKEMAKATHNLLNKDSNISAIVLECTNMPPYIETVKMIANIPVFDLNQLVNYHFDALIDS